MSDSPNRPSPRGESRIERWQPYIASITSALLHLLMLVILLWSSQAIVTAPQGAASGSRMRVQYVSDNRDSAQPPPSPPPSRPPTPQARTEVSRDRIPPNSRRPDAEAVQPPAEQQAQSQQQASAAPPSPPARRKPETWTGRPPGLIEEDRAPENTGDDRGPGVQRGNQHDIMSAEPSMEVGGYQVYYDLRNEERLRAWKAQGVTELFLPLPGTKKYMICPLQIALTRSSGKCRLLDPDAPEMVKIGDARQIITVMDVYRRGEKVWSGPGAYR